MQAADRGDDKPRNIEQYQVWLEERHGVASDRRLRTHHEAVVDRVERDFRSSPFWTALETELKTFHETYLVETRFALLRSVEPPKLIAKPFGSFLLKTYRRNVVENVNWPEAPPGGWLTPPGWFGQVNDLVRTRFEVKYLDGVAFLAEHLQALGAANGMQMTVDFQASEEGYYAAHIGARDEFEIPRRDWDTERREISVELQITTQLQEAILQLTHKFYDERRRRHRKADLAWQWDYASDEFVGNYLGHILHYVEGMIMDVRNKQGGK